MTEAIAKSNATTGRGPGRPVVYATKEDKTAAFRERKRVHGLVLAWVPNALVDEYRATEAARGAA